MLRGKHRIAIREAVARVLLELAVDQLACQRRLIVTIERPPATDPVLARLAGEVSRYRAPEPLHDLLVDVRRGRHRSAPETDRSSLRRGATTAAARTRAARRGGERKGVG